jgi:hypothetical protein
MTWGIASPALTLKTSYRAGPLPALMAYLMDDADGADARLALPGRDLRLWRYRRTRTVARLPRRARLHERRLTRQQMRIGIGARRQEV